MFENVFIFLTNSNWVPDFGEVVPQSAAGLQ
jgi:hypothetical protein